MYIHTCIHIYIYICIDIDKDRYYMYIWQRLRRLAGRRKSSNKRLSSIWTSEE